MHPSHLVVDAANVVGSRPDGWWRNRAGAAARLVDRITAAVADGSLDPPVTVVLEGQARAGVAAGRVAARPEQSDTSRADGQRTDTGRVDGERADTGRADRERADGLAVLHAKRDGDSAIVALARSLLAKSNPVRVVTADRGLRERVVAAGGEVIGPSWLLDRLSD